MAADERTLSDDGVRAPYVPIRAGKYRITGKVGQGGMGVVYRAMDDDLGRAVALKFIPSHLADNPTSEQRFLREARAASALDHPNIGTIFGVEETEDHRRFIVMAYYEGQNLGERMGNRSNPLGAEDAIRIGIQIARGLDAAHARGVIHRDIKPSNILLAESGLVKIVDFGLASMGDSEHLTQTGARLGTPAYMSPEQALGNPLDHRSDIWSLGVVLCEMVTRQRAFESDSVPAILFKVVHGELPNLGALDPALRSILEKALQREPSERFQTMGELLAALEMLDMKAVKASASKAPSAVGGIRSAVTARVSAWPPRGRMRVGLVAAAIAILFVLTLLFRDRIFSGDSAPKTSATLATTPYDKYLRGMELAKRWDKDGNLDQAVGLFTEVTQQDPDFALAWARLADVQRIRYVLTRNKAWLEEATKNANEAARRNAGLSPVQVVLGRLQATQGNIDVALASFEHALRIDANDADAHTAIARHYEELGRLKDADASYERAIALDPENAGNRDSYANYLFRQNRYDEAIRQWQVVVRSMPDNAVAHINLGSALSQEGKVAEAIAMFEKAIALNPNYMAYSNRGTAYFRAGRYQDAASSFERALKLDDSDSMVWGNLAAAYWYVPGRENEARQTFQRAVEMAEAARKRSPRDAYVHSDLATYYAKLKQPDLAKQRLQTALALAPDSPEICIVAAEVKETLGDRAGAIEAARRAVELGFPRQRLQRIRELSELLKDPGMKSDQ